MGGLAMAKRLTEQSHEARLSQRGGLFLRGEWHETQSRFRVLKRRAVLLRDDVRGAGASDPYVGVGCRR